MRGEKREKRETCRHNGNFPTLGIIPCLYWEERDLTRTPYKEERHLTEPCCAESGQLSIITWSLTNYPEMCGPCRTSSNGALTSCWRTWLATSRHKDRHWVWDDFSVIMFMKGWHHFWELFKQRKGDSNDCNTGAPTAGPEQTCCVTMCYTSQQPCAPGTHLE